MATTITFVAELTKEGLRRIRDEIDALLGADGEVVQPAASPASAGSSLDPLAAQLKGGLSAPLRKLVRHIVDNHVGHEFTWDDVAKEMKADLGSVKSWHRSLSKPLNRIGRANPAAPWFLKSRWDGSRNNYTVSPEWAEAIKRIW